MKVFISWSGQKSLGIARQLGKWLPYIIQAITPFVSSGNIRKGARWSDVLAEELKETQYGIICITRQNVMSPWLNFEAGALSKMIGQSYVSPLLCGVDPSRLEGPLSQFQATVFDEAGEDVFRLVSSINNSLPLPQQVHPEILSETFTKWWPDFGKDLREIVSKRTDETETGYRWLFSVEDLISEESKGWQSVWVITPAPLKDWYLLRSTVQKNLEHGVTYEFIVPSNVIDEFKDLVTNEFKRLPGNDNSALDLSKLSIGSIEEHEFKNSAVTHYRILNPTAGSKKVLFEVPIAPCGYWVNTEGEAVDGFFSRFAKMRDMAKCKPISNSPKPATKLD